MRKFEVVFIMLFMQVSFILVGMTEIQSGHRLITPYIDQTFFGAISGLGNSYTSMENAFRGIQSVGIFASQPFQLNIPAVNPIGLIPGHGNFFTSVPALTLDVPGLGFLGVLGAIVSLVINIGMLLIAMFISSVIFAGVFYSAIMLTLLPANVSGQSFALIIGLMLGLIQMVYMVYEALTTISSITAFATGFGFNFKGEQEK